MGDGYRFKNFIQSVFTLGHIVLPIFNVSHPASRRCTATCNAGRLCWGGRNRKITKTVRNGEPIKVHFESFLKKQKLIKVKNRCSRDCKTRMVRFIRMMDLGKQYKSYISLLKVSTVTGDKHTGK